MIYLKIVVFINSQPVNISGVSVFFKEFFDDIEE